MERDGIFAGDDPFAIARQWLEAAQETEINDPNAAALATVDPDGMPNVRIVLVKQIAADGIVFFTNHDSAKGRELAANPKAAMVLHWKSLRRQLRLRGPVAHLPAAESDAYYASRPLQSRLGAWASKQSRPLASRAELVAEVARIGARKGPNPPRPPFWGGFKIAPDEFEFWADGAFRLHDRFRWRREGAGNGWQTARLNP